MTDTHGLDLTAMPIPNGKVLVAGDAGLIGSYAARVYHELGWEVHGVSGGDLDLPWRHHRADLLTGEGLPDLSGITHLVFGAYLEKPTDAAPIEVNDALLQNTLDALRDTGAPLRHVTLYQGGKAYGHHLGFFNTRRRRPTPG